MSRTNRLKIKGIYFLYRTLQALGLPLLVLYFLYRGLRERGYWGSLPQRFGFLPRSFKQTSPGAIWLHAVSVGEVAGCVVFLRRLRAQFPHTRLFVSTGTLTGQATANEKLRGVADGVFFVPVDYVFAVRRVLRTLQPSVVVIAETEIWPNLFRETKRTETGLMLVNGRISDRAFVRYQKFAWFFRAILPQADLVMAQSAEIAQRFAALGAPADRLQNGGSFKYDFDTEAARISEPVQQFLERVKPEKIWIAASTMPPAEAGDVDEDGVVIDAFQQLASKHAGLLMILAPRKPAAFGTTAQRLASAGIHFVRRTELGAQGLTLPGVLLLDTIGELSALFGVADVVFMGGTLAQRGGHNILEAAFHGKPVIAGPHMENFRAIADAFHDANAWVEIGEARALAGAVDQLLSQPETARAIGKRALACATASGGASDRAAGQLRQLYNTSLRHYRPAMPWYVIAKTLSYVWAHGGKRVQSQRLMAEQRLDAPVISVGNITMGGTGKTPCVLRVVELLKSRGYKPGILTRGYGRVSHQSLTIAAPGESIPTQQTGDEPQIFLRSAEAPVGICADRHRAGRQLRNQFLVDALVLDDGFQHVQLARKVDIVLIDALDPFGGGDLFPLGRLREPPQSLARADIVLITRANYSDLAPAIEHRVREWNEHAPVFPARVEPLAWVEHSSGRTFPPDAPPFGVVGAFCALGNPQSFHRTLSSLNVTPVDWVEFDDHHHYRPNELRRLSYQFAKQGATAVVTTEKDAVNLCEGCDSLLEPLPLYYLKVTLVVDREDEFLETIIRGLKRD